MSGQPDIDPRITLGNTERAGNQFAASIGTGNNVFTAFIEGNAIKVKCSGKGGKNISVAEKLIDVSGNEKLKLLKVASRGDIAVVVAVIDDGTQEFKVRGSTGKIQTIPGSSPPTYRFIHQQCPDGKVHRGSEIYDLAIRINDDGTSDDYIFVKSSQGADVSHVGHHPNAPS
jgi:hypothetical protein